MAFSIPEVTLEEIKARVDIAELIASYGIQVRTAGSSKKACCPFHNEKTPSFHINDRKGVYHCFGCGESGDAFKFVQKMEGLSFVEAAKKLAAQCGVEIKEKEDPKAGHRKRLYALLAELAAFYRRCLVQTKEAQIARDYLAKRELNEEIQEAWTIGYAPNGMVNILKWAEKYKFSVQELEDAGVIIAPKNESDHGYHRFGGRLMFTIRDRQGRAVGFSGRLLVEKKNTGKYVNSPQTELFSKNQILFGFDKAAAAIAKDKHHEVIVCEGQIDCIRLHSKGFVNSVASQGTAFTEEHMKMLHRVAESAILVFDDDAAGHKAAIRSAGMLLAFEMPVRVVALPNGDDPDSFLRTKGAEAFRKLLDTAESIMSFQCRVERAKEANPESIDAVARITRAVLTTLAQSKNEILKAAMLDEAAKLLKLPRHALAEELKKVAVGAVTPFKIAPEVPPPETSAPEREVTAVVENREPPTPKEFAFCQFLMANEYDTVLNGMVGEFLPKEVFSSDFVARFVDRWRAQCAEGEEDQVLAFAAALDPLERGWFDRILAGSGKCEASALSATEILQDFIRGLWIEYLKRRRGELPASGDGTVLADRMQITVDLKRLNLVKWHTVKDLLRSYIKGND